jgi:hypothetical protein
MKLTTDIRNRLSKFFSSYKHKANFIENLSRRRRAADEIILLSCCYIDQLGSCVFHQAGSSRRNFELMLLKHSGENEELSKISVANLSFDVLWMAESASYTIPKPGRVQLQSDELKPLTKFIDQTGIAFTERTVRNLFVSIYDCLKSNFRIHP